MQIKIDYVSNLNKDKLIMPGYRIGSPTSPMTANQLKEFSARLNEGMKNVEIGTINPEVLDTVPTEHLETIRQLSKLTGSNVSVHAPIVDPAGFDDKGNWNEHQRRVNEEQIHHILEKVGKLSKNGSIPVVFHGTGGVFAQQYDSSLEKKMPDKDYYDRDEYGNPKIKKDSEGRPLYHQPIRALGLIDQTQGRITAVEYEEKFSPGKEQPEIWDPWKRAYSLNQTKWDEEKLKLLSYQKEIEELKERLIHKFSQNQSLQEAGLNRNEFPQYQDQYRKNQTDIELLNQHIHQIEQHLNSSYSELHTQLVKFKPVKDTEGYKEYQEKFPEYQREIAALNKKEKDLVEKIKTGNEENRKRIIGQLQELREQRTKTILTELTGMPTPEIIKPVEEFAAEKTAETFSKAMYKYYTNHKNEDINKMPILSIENVYPTSPLGRAEELRQAIEQTREKFAALLVEKEKFNKKEAKVIAEKLIGATWDVGHINLMRRAGYSEKETKEILVEETKKIAPFVKHLHVTDNFGFGDTHLPPGEGNVPIKEMMEELEKRGFSGRAIIEAGNFVKEFGVSPTHDVLEYFNSPMFRKDSRAYNEGKSPYWQPEMFSPYTYNFIEFPQQHFNLYGSSFTTLPRELGGQTGVDRSRFSDTPNA